jgi:hypothetical protein
MEIASTCINIGEIFIFQKKYEEAYAEWNRELRQRVYIEMREPPL